ncbi:unnamed protein product [Brassica rapa]|uniref:Uncharacterized protein n=2 Tax=Brassica TaxID=3705 RepID=A0A8D9H8K3_BRACM|nr:unnamed protein product [Brassica napus]CAG7893464.1 unnamed protein product [Brassica rapa]
MQRREHLIIISDGACTLQMIQSILMVADVRQFQTIEARSVSSLLFSLM